MPTASSYMKMRTMSGIIDVPIFPLTDVADSSLRIRQTGGAIGAFNLVDASESPLRIRTMKGIKGISLVEEVAPPDPGIANWAGRTPDNGALVTLIQNDDTLAHTSTNGNGHGLYIPLTTNLTPGQQYAVTARVEMVASVDDVITVHIRNLTQASYISLSGATSTFDIGTVQDLSFNFTPTSGNYTAGDNVVIMIVQSWRNGTHDKEFEMKIYNYGTSCN